MDWLTEFGGVGNITASAALLVLIVLLVRGFVLGKIIPDTIHDRIVAAKDQQIATLTRATDRQAGQVDKLVEQGESTLKILQAISVPADDGIRP